MQNAEKPIVFILNGPNLKMLGIREPERYGSRTLQDLEFLCRQEGDQLGLEVDFRQTVHEGVLVEWVHESHNKALGVILNAGGYARTSIALQGAVKAVATPVIEVHLANIANRESSRPSSYLSKVARGTIFGFGFEGYLLALQAIHRLYVRRGEGSSGVQ